MNNIDSNNSFSDNHRQYVIVIVAIILSLLLQADGMANEIVPIARIVEDAKTLAARLVTFKGRIETLEKMPSVPIQSCFMITRYRVLVVDESGSIVALICGRHVDEGEVRIGDLVVIRAVLEVDESDRMNRIITAIGVRMERVQ